MNKNTLNNIIKEEIVRIIKEEHELLKAQDACKGGIFRVKKEYEKILEKLKANGYIESYTLKVGPYNTGYMLYKKIKETSTLSNDTSKPAEIIKSLIKQSNIYIQPSMEFEDDYETNNAYLQAYFSKLNGSKFVYSGIKYEIKNKQDIKKQVAQFVMDVLNEFGKIDELL